MKLIGNDSVCVCARVCSLPQPKNFIFAHTRRERVIYASVFSFAHTCARHCALKFWKKKCTHYAHCSTLYQFRLYVSSSLLLLLLLLSVCIHIRANYRTAAANGTKKETDTTATTSSLELYANGTPKNRPIRCESKTATATATTTTVYQQTVRKIACVCVCVSICVQSDDSIRIYVGRASPIHPPSLCWCVVCCLFGCSRASSPPFVARP